MTDFVKHKQHQLSLEIMYGLVAELLFYQALPSGDNVVIGAGSVVTKNIPDNVIAVGSPCRVVRRNQ